MLWIFSESLCIFLCTFQAVSVATTISDRICIHSNGKLQPEISGRHLMTCSRGYGCYGGGPFIAWAYWKSDGLVTGGSYGSKVVSRHFSNMSKSVFGQLFMFVCNRHHT